MLSHHTNYWLNLRNVLLLVSATANKIPSHGGFHPMFCMLFLYTAAQVKYLQYEVNIILNLLSESYFTALQSYLRWLVLFSILILAE